MFSIRDKRILITGSSGGLGFIFARELGKLGARIILNGRTRSRLSAAARALSKEHIDVFPVPFDIGNSRAVENAVALIEKKAGPIDVLINNAGINLRAPLEEVTDRMWHCVMNTNLNGLFFVSRAVARRMIARRRGSIINIASLMSKAARPTTGPYTASKGGVKLLTRAMAAEWGRHHLRVNAVGPGYFLTDMTRNLKKKPAFDRWVRGKTPAGRWGDPQELIGPLVFFASEASSFVNGQILYVDGGFLSAL